MFEFPQSHGGIGDINSVIYTPFSQQVNNPDRDPHFLLCFASFKILHFFGLSHRIPRKIKNAVNGCKYLMVPEIFKKKYCVTYANEMTDDIIDSTKYNINYINSAILVNLKQKPLKLGRLIGLPATHLRH